MLNVSLIEAPVSASDVSFRQEKEAWIKAKYVERKFLKKMCGSEALVEGSRKPHHWSVKKCRRHNSSIRAPKTRRKYRHDAGIVSPANLSAGNCLVISEHVCSTHLSENWTSCSYVQSSQVDIMSFCFCHPQLQQLQSFGENLCFVLTSLIHSSLTLTQAQGLAVSSL